MSNYPLILNREASRSIDHRAMQEFGMPGIVLMENAGRGVADFLLAKYTSGSVLICCGKGNNAGDGLVVARYLDNQGIPVQVLLFSSPDELAEDAKINYQIVVKCGIPVIFCCQETSIHQQIKTELDQPAWIVDALFGTGLAGAVKAPYDTAIQTINTSPANILSIDIPSGLDCDSGVTLGATIKADYTVTFVGMKKGFLNTEAKTWLGEIHVIDIGIPKILIHD